MATLCQLLRRLPNLRLRDRNDARREVGHAFQGRLPRQRMGPLLHADDDGVSSSSAVSFPFLKPRTYPTPPPPPARAITLIASRRSWSLLAIRAYPVRRKNPNMKARDTQNPYLVSLASRARSSLRSVTC